MAGILHYISGNGCKHWHNGKVSLVELEATLSKNSLQALMESLVNCRQCASRSWGHCKALDYQGLITRGGRCESDGGISYWVFRADMSDMEIQEYLEIVGVPLEGVHNPPSQYDCTGRYFSYPIDVIRKGSRILVKQHYGYDV